MSKFINKATTEYMKSKAGATLQQRIGLVETNIEERELKLRTEVNNLRQFAIDEASEARARLIDEMDERLTDKTNLRYQIEDLELVLNKKIKKLTIITAVLAAGVLACLIKLLI